MTRKPTPIALFRSFNTNAPFVCSVLPFLLATKDLVIYSICYCKFFPDVPKIFFIITGVSFLISIFKLKL
jgi:hypothetical protein